MKFLIHSNYEITDRLSYKKYYQNYYYQEYEMEYQEMGEGGRKNDSSFQMYVLNS